MATSPSERCRAWNADHTHQVMAGQARARGFTHEHQVMAGNASFAAFSTRMRAGNGSPQLFPQAAAKYVAPEQIGVMGHRLPPTLQAIIHTTWAAGIGWGVEHWLLPKGVTPPPPDGSLFAEGNDHHDWRDFALGWLVCDGCWLAAICPLCQPDWIAHPILARLLQALCLQHQGGA